MKSSLEVCMTIGIFAFLTGSMTGSAMGSFPESDVSRATRDVPMLRLGRASPTEDEVASALGTMPFGLRGQFLAILKELMEQQAARDETRRQPPLPRYGRRSVPLALNRRTSESSNERASRIFHFDFSGEDDPVYRPPPRGGRYKREVAASILSGQPKTGGLPKVYFPRFLADPTMARQRSVALPRIGRYLHEGGQVRGTKDFPHSDLSGVTGSTKQAGSQSDSLADPREV